jgi:ribosomal protein S18 acetylase RimI-like enzyme
MGRVLSDGVSDAYIQDLVILPEYRGSGIGESLVRFLLEYCTSRDITWVGVIAEPGSASFYQKLGLKPMKSYTPLVYQQEELSC